MLTINTSWRVLAAVSVTAAFLVACNNGGPHPTASPPPPEGVIFSVFATQAFSNSANSTPVGVDLTFKYDVDDDPTAFDTLIASGSFGE